MIKKFKKDTFPMGTEEVTEYGKAFQTGMSNEAAMDREPGGTGTSLLRKNVLYWRFICW